MAQKKPAAKKAATKKPVAKRARNKDGTYKGDDKSTPDVNEAYKQPKPGTKATTKPRNPAAKQRESTAKKPHVYAPKVRPLTTPVKDMLTKDIKPAETMPPTLSRFTPPPPKKKGRVGKMWTWLVGE
jgi:hypothetical protein